jgi:cysteine desulfurase
MSIYLDYNATSPLRAGVKRAMLEAMDMVGNPSSIHRYGRDVRLRLEDCRGAVAAYFSTSPAQVVFTSGATEANNTIVQGFQGRVIISAIEHDSVSQASDHALVCPVDQDGLVDLKVLETLLSESREPTLVSVMVANNETGVIQPLRDVIDLARRHKAFVRGLGVPRSGRDHLFNT